MKREARQAEILQRPPDEARFQKREWRAQRIGWAVLAAIILAALSGLLGDGPAAHQVISTPVAKIEMVRFGRRAAALEWKITPIKRTAGTLRISMDAAFAQQFEIKSIQPEATSARLSGAQWIYDFDSIGGAQPSSAAVVFHVEPRHMGLHRGRLQIGDADPVAVAQFIYP